MTKNKLTHCLRTAIMMMIFSFCLTGFWIDNAQAASTGVISGGVVNVRSEPSTANNNVIGQILKDTRVEVLATQGEWCRIKFSNLNGWVAKSLLQIDQAPGSVPGVVTSPNDTIAGLKPPTVYLNEQMLSFEVPPRIENSRTLVPLRAIFEEMGAQVDWNEITRTVTAHRGDITVILPLNSLTPTVNGKVYRLETPAKIVNDRTLAPLRFVGEAFGGQVDWNEQTRVIKISLKDNEVNGQEIIVKQVNGNTINIRSGPAVDFDRIDAARSGERFTVLGQKDGWYQVSRGGRVGWISGDLVELRQPGGTGSQPQQPPVTQPSNTLSLKIAREPSGLKLIMHSSEPMSADKSRNGNKLIYEFTDMGLEGKEYLEAKIGSSKLLVRARTQEENLRVEVEIPSGIEHQSYSALNGQEEIVFIPNFILGIERKGYGSTGERIIVSTLTPCNYSSRLNGERLEVKLESMGIGEAEQEYRFGSPLLDRIQVTESGGSQPVTTLNIYTENMGKHTFFQAAGENTLNILLMDKRENKPRERLVVLDPGHGGSDPGAQGMGGLYKEKENNLDIAQTVGQILTAQGIRVEYTRTDDSYVGLEERAATANLLNAAVFVSIHNNGSTNLNANGTESYFYAPLEMPELMFQREERQKLAARLQEELINKLNRSNRGVKENNLAVLRYTEMPSALVEIAFISNFEEGQLLSQKYFRNLAAEAIATAIAEYMQNN